MAIVSPCTYDAQGRFTRPSRFDIGRAKIGLDLDTGGSLTFDRDRVHVQTVTASGLTADQARRRMTTQLARFFERADAVSGYRKITTITTQGITPCNGNVTITCEILYAIEAPTWARSHRPQSPSTEYRRDQGVTACG